MKIPRYITSLIFLLLLLGFPVQSYSQSKTMRQSSREIEKSGGEQEQPKSRKVKKAEAKIAAAKEKQDKAYAKAKQKDMQHRMDLQTPQTRQRMKESKKQADQNNDRYHQTLWQKIFGRKK